MNAFDIVTSSFISQLSNNTVPWHKSWRPGYHGAISRSMRKAYSPLNQMLLSRQGEYIGVQAAIDMHADFRGVRREEAVWASRYDKKTGEVDPDTGEEKTRTLWGYKRHGVLPVALLKDKDGNPLQPLTPPEMQDESLATLDGIDTMVSSFLERTGLTLRVDASLDPGYNDTAREVTIPPVQCFSSQAAYYAALFRALVEATAAPALLDRGVPTTEGQLIQEQLTLEIGSSLLCSAYGLDTDEVFDNSVAYAQLWISHLSEHRTVALHAAERAERAVNLILGISREAQNAVCS